MTTRANTEEPPLTHRTVIALALPMTLATMSTPLLGFVDLAVIGRLDDPTLLAAIAAAAVIFDFVFWGFGFLRLGTAGLTAQALGARDAAEQRATLWRALLLAMGLAALLVVLQRPIARLAFVALGAPASVTAAARSYFDIRIWSAPFALCNYVVLGALIGRGRTDLGLLLQVLINLGNILLNIALVAGLGWGVRGSAAGTLVAEAAGTLVGLGVLLRLEGWSPVEWGRVTDRTAMVRTLGINRDIMIRSAALMFAFAFFTAQGARQGDVVMAANAVLMNLFLIASYFLDGFATAAEQLCGYAVGARDATRFRRAASLSVGWCFGFAACVWAVALLGGHAFVDLVTSSASVRGAADQFLPYAALTPVCGAAAFAFDGIFTGATWTRDMRNLMVVALLAYFALYAALRPLGNAGLWTALLGFLTARGLLQAWRYRGLATATFAGTTVAPTA